MTKEKLIKSIKKIESTGLDILDESFLDFCNERELRSYLEICEKIISIQNKWLKSKNDSEIKFLKNEKERFETSLKASFDGDLKKNLIRSIKEYSKLFKDNNFNFLELTTYTFESLLILHDLLVLYLKLKFNKNSFKLNEKILKEIMILFLNKNHKVNKDIILKIEIEKDIEEICNIESFLDIEVTRKHKLRNLDKSTIKKILEISEKMVQEFTEKKFKNLQKEKLDLIHPKEDFGKYKWLKKRNGLFEIILGLKNEEKIICLYEFGTFSIRSEYSAKFDGNSFYFVCESYETEKIIDSLLKGHKISIDKKFLQ